MLFFVEAKEHLKVAKIAEMSELNISSTGSNLTVGMICVHWFVFQIGALVFSP